MAPNDIFKNQWRYHKTQGSKCYITGTKYLNGWNVDSFSECLFKFCMEYFTKMQNNTVLNLLRLHTVEGLLDENLP